MGLITIFKVVSELCVCVCVSAHTQSYLMLCDCMDCSLLGSSVHGIFQARILEPFATSYSRGSSQPRDRTRISHVSCIGRQILPLVPPGKPHTQRSMPILYNCIEQPCGLKPIHSMRLVGGLSVGTQLLKCMCSRCLSPNYESLMCHLQ